MVWTGFRGFWRFFMGFRECKEFNGTEGGEANGVVDPYPKENKGIVVFSPSYDFKKFLLTKFIDFGISERLKENCKIFEESEEESAEKLLKRYQEEIDKKESEPQVCMLF